MQSFQSLSKDNIKHKCEYEASEIFNEKIIHKINKYYSIIRTAIILKLLEILF